MVYLPILSKQSRQSCILRLLRIISAAGTAIICLTKAGTSHALQGAGGCSIL